MRLPSPILQCRGRLKPSPVAQMQMLFRGLERKKRSNRLDQSVEFIGKFVAVEPLPKPGDKRVQLQAALEILASMRR